MKSSTTLVFVYGTLKRGKGNNVYLNDSKFLGEDHVRGSLYVSGIPYFVNRGDTLITGEVYEVSPGVLNMLDKLEGHPSWYRRIKLPTIGQREVNIYSMSLDKVPTGARVLENGNY